LPSSRHTCAHTDAQWALKHSEKTFIIPYRLYMQNVHILRGRAADNLFTIMIRVLPKPSASNCHKYKGWPNCDRHRSAGIGLQTPVGQLSDTPRQDAHGIEPNMELQVTYGYPCAHCFLSVSLHFHTAQRLSRSAQPQHRNNIGVLLMHTSSKHSCNAVAGPRCVDQCQPPR
jgi:hypothetical protein